MKIKLYFKNIKEFILDLLFPKECLGCGQEEVWLCEDCFNKIKIKNELLKNYDYLDGVWAAADYKDPLLQKLIHFFKYSFITELAKPLSQIILKSLIDYEGEPWLLLPVPLHRRRFLERGFNQAELLAQEVNGANNWPVLNQILYRQKYTKPQVKLKREERLNNLKDVFACLSAPEIFNKNILLVDDVMTTGATLSECAKILKRAGANRVRGLVVAHG